MCADSFRGRTRTRERQNDGRTERSGCLCVCVRVEPNPVLLLFTLPDNTIAADLCATIFSGTADISVAGKRRPEPGKELRGGGKGAGPSSSGCRITSTWSLGECRLVKSAPNADPQRPPVNLPVSV